MIKCDDCHKEFEVTKMVNLRLKNGEKEFYFKFCCFGCLLNWIAGMKDLIKEYGV